MVQRKRLTLDEKAFYDLLIARTKHYNSHEHGYYNLDPREGEVEVYFFDAPNGYGCEMYHEAITDFVVNSHSKNKGLDYNSDASISLTGSSTASFRRLTAEWSGIIDDENSDWRGGGFEGIYYWIVETNEYREIEEREQKSSSEYWWQDALRHTPFEDLPEKYRHNPDYSPYIGEHGDSIDGVEWIESERCWHQSKETHTFHIVMPAIYKAIKDGELGITPEELEEFFWKNQDWGDNLVEHDFLTGNEYTRDWMLKDGDFWYFIPELLKRQAVQGYGSPLIQAVRLRIAENSTLYGLCMNMNFCVTERKNPDRWHKFITYTVWCPAFKVRIIHNPSAKESEWAGALFLRPLEYAVLDYSVFGEESDLLSDEGWGRVRTGPMMEAFGGMRIIPQTLLKRGLLDGEI